MNGLRPFWEPPDPPPALDAAVLRAYRRHIARPRRLRRVWIPVAAAVLATASAGIFAGVRIQRALYPPQRELYVPVRQPRIVVISQEDRP